MREIPYKGNSSIKGKSVAKGNPLSREIPSQGKSLIKGNPL
jgi:hypothetical protein